MLDELSKDLIYTLDPIRYAKGLRFDPFPWQETVIYSQHKRKVINGARQSGKSTIIALKPCHRAKYFPGSLSIILAATEKQSTEDLLKIKDFIAYDPQYPELTRESDSLITLKNGSRIVVVPATEKSARGYSSPDLIILDEASRIEDSVITSGVIPMLTDNEKCELLAISTPNGRTGFFWKAWNSKSWERFEIRAPWDIKYGELCETEQEARYVKRKAAEHIKAWYSPRHYNETEQRLNLEVMDEQMYRQEYLCEFVEPEEQIFDYDDIKRMFDAGEGVEPLTMVLTEEETSALYI